MNVKKCKKHGEDAYLYLKSGWMWWMRVKCSPLIGADVTMEMEQCNGRGAVRESAVCSG